MALLKALRPTLPVLIGASVMLTLSMGQRQSLGIFLQPLGRDRRRDHPDCLRADPPGVTAAAEGSLEPDCSTFGRLLAEELAKGQACCRMLKTESEMVQALASTCGWHGFWIGIA